MGRLAVAISLLSLSMIACSRNEAAKDRPWALPNWQYDETDGGNLIYIDGTLKGPHVGYPVNTWSIHCVRREMNCYVATVSEIGMDQLGSITQYVQPVSSWNETTIVLRDDENTSACALEVITINRASKSVAFDSLARNQDRDYCKQAHRPEDYHWTIGQPHQPWEK